MTRAVVSSAPWRSPLRAASAWVVLWVMAFGVLPAAAQTGDPNQATTHWVIKPAALSMSVPDDMSTFDLKTKKGKKALRALTADPHTAQIVRTVGMKNVLGLASGFPVSQSTTGGATTIDVGWRGILVFKIGSSKGLTPEQFVAEYKDDFEAEVAPVPVENVTVAGVPALRMSGVNEVAPGSIDAHTNYVLVTPKGVIEIGFNTQAGDATGHEPWVQSVIDSAEISS